MDPSGGMTVLTGVTNPGGGNETGIAQLVADAVGACVEDVAVVQGDTAVCPYGFGNGAGRSLVVGGGAALLAAREVRASLDAAAASLFGVDAAQVEIADGVARARDGRSLRLGEIAYAVYTRGSSSSNPAEAPLESTCTYKPGNVAASDERGRMQPYPTYSNGVYVAIVEVDTETGVVELVDLAAVHDCGVMVNPALVEGQLHGGAAMGIGAALSEHLVYDDRGRLLTDRFKTYLLPRAGDLPALRVGHFVTPSPFTLTGSKGAGEAGLGGALAAVTNAVDDALSPLGATVRELPLTPPAVLRLLEATR
jgi:carbon-monoxide dehydrogenase large subunit